MNEKDNITGQDDDLTGMAPKLSKLKSDNPFKTDNDYFEKFNSKLQNRIDDYEETHREAPVLSGIPKFNEFVVPADYFDEFPARIQQRVVSKSPSSVLEWFLLLIKPRVAVPLLSVALLALAGINFMNKNASFQKTETA